jgi:uncharacterized protein
MEITVVDPGARALIQAYGDGGFRVSGRRSEGAVLVLENSIIEVGYISVEEIRADHLQPALDAVPPVEILFMGCGERAQVLPVEAHGILSRAKISVETMDTGAACRTFNLLQGEGRRVAALLIAVA